MLKHGGATTRTTVPVSAGLLNDTESYFDALTAYRNGDPSEIVNRFADAAFAAIGNGRELAQDLLGCYEAWSSAIKLDAPRQSGAYYRRCCPSRPSRPY